MEKRYSVITASGSYIPPVNVPNQAFLNREFYDNEGQPLASPIHDIIEKFKEITTIAQRKYVPDDLTTSDIAALAAKSALESSNTDPETLDYLIVAHNFGDTNTKQGRSEYVPCLAAKVKQKLGINNPDTVAYDIAFGCPGWLQAMIQADYYLRSGDANRIMVIGAEVLSRVSDPHDRDSMIYADGAGAVILEAKTSSTPIGILAHKAQSDSLHYSNMLRMGRSYNPDYAAEGNHFLKMNGRKLYQYALENVPLAVKSCLDKAGICLKDIQKVLIHQANGKMDEAILKRLFRLYGEKEIPADLMPMTIADLGNSSVATLPTLYDLLQKNKLEGQTIHQGDTLLFTSVGAGMSINALVYRVA